uniref:COR domain-containing protein n=1 Tax=Amphimedon queenslandica TaxID=400682 RepID=A0A1X7SSV2_AMPQE
LVAEKKLKEMNESLKEYKANKKVISYNENEGSIIFPVNTLLPAGSKEREEASIQLCTTISNFGVAMTIKLPIRLFIFEIALQLEAEKKKRSFLTKEEVTEIGKSLQLDKESDINAALQYLHNVTIILYYREVEILKDLIFVNPKPILDVLSCLIAVTYVDHDKLQQIADPPPSIDERKTLKNFGCFKVEILKIIGKKIFDEVFKLSHMITLLMHFHIIAKVENKKEGDYFFPCALPSYDKLNDPPTEIQPLLIAWEINDSGTTTLAIPQGLFPLTIVHLLEKKDDVDFSPVGKDYYRCNDAMSLCVYKDCTIDIINRYTHIELRFRGHKESCPLIFKLVTEAIKKISKDLNVDKDYIFAFKCPRVEHCYCIVQEDKSSTRCTQCRSQCKVLQGDDDSYRCWFGNSLSFSSAKQLEEDEVELKATDINMHGLPGADGSQHLLNKPPPEKLTDSTQESESTVPIATVADKIDTESTVATATVTDEIDTESKK